MIKLFQKNFKIDKVEQTFVHSSKVRKRNIPFLKEIHLDTTTIILMETIDNELLGIYIEPIKN